MKMHDWILNVSVPFCEWANYKNEQKSTKKSEKERENEGSVGDDGVNEELGNFMAYASQLPGYINTDSYF